MLDWTEQQLAILRPNYPNWDLWVVHAPYGRDTWCARPKGSPIATVNTDSPEHLVEEIAEQEAAAR